VAKAKKLQDLSLVYATALAMIEKGGIGSISSRKLAAELAISPMTLYNYYKDINALLREVLLFGLSRFSADQYELLHAGLKRGENPLNYFLHLPESLNSFAEAHPNLYAFYFNSNLRTFLPDGKVLAGYQKGFELVRGFIRDPAMVEPIHDHIFLYEIVANSLVMRRLRYPEAFPQERFLSLCGITYDRLLGPDEPFLEAWEEGNREVAESQ